MEAHDAGFDTAVLCDAQGFLTEGPGFNIFIVKDGRVTTPDRGSLRGITRQSVLELCAELGIEAAVEPIPRSALDMADEVFLATTAGGVMPASRIGTRILGNDRPGPLSMRLKDSLLAQARGRLASHPGPPAGGRRRRISGGTRTRVHFRPCRTFCRQMLILTLGMCSPFTHAPPAAFDNSSSPSSVLTSMEVPLTLSSVGLVGRCSRILFFIPLSCFFGEVHSIGTGRYERQIHRH